MIRSGLRASLRQLLGRGSLPAAPLASTPLTHPSAGGAPRQADVAVLYRILSLDLPPQRPAGTTADQLAFLLEHEANFPGLQKRWLLHHVGDLDQRQALIELLDAHHQPWQELPFDARVYAATWTDLGKLPPERHPWGPGFVELSHEDQSAVLDYVARYKSLYLLNGNAAANQALQLGWSEANWVFVADSSYYLTLEAWQVIQPLLSLTNLRYFSIPTAALQSAQRLSQPLAQPPLTGDSPPLLGFRRSDSPPFRERLCQGTGAATDMPRRLGLQITWPAGKDLPVAWEPQDATPLLDRGQLVQAGWAYRLPPHPNHGHDQQRHATRLLARKTDMRLIGEALQRQPLRCWIALANAQVTLPGLAAIASNARAVPPLSVTDKPDALPGRDARHYVNVVPHWQSLAGSESGLQRVAMLEAASPLCGDVSQQIDRARLQLMIDCVCALSLDGHLHGNGDSLEHAHGLVRTWFINPATAMIPDGAYARLATLNTARTGLDAAIDFRDLYPLLDAIGLLQRCGQFSSAECQQLDEWFDAFLTWLAADSVSLLRDHHNSAACTWYHLLMLAIAAFRGRRNVAAQVFDNLPGLIVGQFRSDGSPRAASNGICLRHEQLFNLQAWANLIVLSSALGKDLLAWRGSQGHHLQAAFDYALQHLPHDSSSADWLAAMRAMSHRDLNGGLRHSSPFPLLPEVSTGLPPFWSLCQPIALG